jgi:hypothetical protein
LLRGLAALEDAGILSTRQFESKKAKILSSGVMH